MRMIFVGDEWDYGDPSRGHSFEWDTFYQTLLHAGHEVHMLDVGKFRGAEPEHVHASVRALVERVEPEVVFCVLYSDEIPPQVLASVRDDDGVPVINWFCDDHWRYEDFSRRFAPSLTLSVTTSSTAASRYESDGFPHLFSQWGFAHTVYGVHPPVREPKGTIAFVGQPYGNRTRSMEAVSRGISSLGELQAYGHGTPNGRLSAEEMIMLFNRSTASLNFSSSWQPELRTRLKKLQLLPRRLPPQLKARVFEVTGAGGLLVTESSEDLSRYFRPGEEIVVFESISELVDVARRALEDPEWRYKVATAGFQRCIDEHTMTQRLQEVFESDHL